jgi:hypothetical protein
MSLPRFGLPEEMDEAETARLSAKELDALDDDDTTAPAPVQFLLKLPECFAERLAAFQPLAFTAFAAPAAPWAFETTRIDVLRMRQGRVPPRSLVALVASVVLGITLIAGVGGAAAASSDDGPVGISTPAPKKLQKSVRTYDVRAGVAPKIATVATVSVESLARPRARRRWRRR